MHIVFLLDSAAPPRRAVAAVVCDADDLARRGHHVTVVTDAALPGEGLSTAESLIVETLGADEIPPCDVVVATSAATVEAARASDIRAAIARFVLEPAAGGPPVPWLLEWPGLESWPADAHRAPVHRIPRAIDRRTFSPYVHRREGATTVRIGTVSACAEAVRAVVAQLEVLGLDATTCLLDGDEVAEPSQVADRMRLVDVFVATEACSERGHAPEVLEAMACGVPCILADTPLLLACVNGRRDAAMFIEPGDPAGLAEAVAFVSRHAGLRAQLIRGGIEIADGHDRQTRGDELERTLALLAARVDGSTRRDPETMTGATPGPLSENGLAAQLGARADEHARDGHFGEAAACLEAVVVLQPGSVLTLTRLGELLFQNGDLDRALEVLDRAISVGGSSCRLHETRAEVLRSLKRPEDAARALNTAVRSDTASAGTFRALAEALREAGDVAGARIALEEAAVRAAVG